MLVVVGWLVVGWVGGWLIEIAIELDASGRLLVAQDAVLVLYLWVSLLKNNVRLVRD